MNFYEKISKYARKVVLPVVAGVGLAVAVTGCRAGSRLGVTLEKEMYITPCPQVNVAPAPVETVYVAPAPPETLYVKHSGRVRLDVDVPKPEYHWHGHHHGGRHSRADKPGDASGI